MHAQKRLVLSAVTVLALSGAACAQDASEAPGQDPNVELAPPPAEAGVVLETMNAGGYTYALLDAAGQEVWVAGPLTQLALGDTVMLMGADNMGYFRSDALDQEFENLYFVGSFVASNPATRIYAGTVLETMNAAGYTYVQVELSEDLEWLAAPGSEEPVLWLAGPESAVEVGRQVQWQGGSVMRDFHSSTLDRTFPEILFVGGFTVVE